MLAPNPDANTPREPAPEPKPPEVKRRTITLTNRAPISIVENDWPVIAQGSAGHECEGDSHQWDMAIRVRRRKEQPAAFGPPNTAWYIVHAKFSEWDEISENGQLVRVGQSLISDEKNKLWKLIVAVGEELRGRIDRESLRRHVTGVVDRCFAQLPPMTM